MVVDGADDPLMMVAVVVNLDADTNQKLRFSHKPEILVAVASLMKAAPVFDESNTMFQRKQHHVSIKATLCFRSSGRARECSFHTTNAVKEVELVKIWSASNF